jgi:hypothetical protein
MLTLDCLVFLLREESMGKFKVVRGDIYQRIWDRPAQTVARELGISGTRLKKICKELGVPTPPRGYWAKIEAGRTVMRAPLPDTATRQVMYCDSTAKKHRDAPPPDLGHLLHQIKKEEESCLPPIVMYVDGPLRTACVQAISERHSFHKPNCISDAISTSPERRYRALCIADALVEALRQRGFKAQEREGRLVISRRLFEMTVRLTDVDSLNGQPTASPGSLGLGLRLILRQINGRGLVHARDEANRTIDDQLGRVVLGIRRAEATNAYYTDRAAVESQRLVAKLELEKVSQLWEEVDTWLQVQQCRTYLDRFEAELAATGASFGNDSSPVAWLRWARSVCDTHDPMLARVARSLAPGMSREAQ